MPAKEKNKVLDEPKKKTRLEETEEILRSECNFSIDIRNSDILGVIAKTLAMIYDKMNEQEEK